MTMKRPAQSSGSPPKELFALLTTPWIIAVAFSLAVLLLVSILSLLWFTRRFPVSVAASTAVIHIIPAPSATLEPPTITPTPYSTPTSAIPPSPAPGVISVGSYVKISNTDGDGLRLRSEPGFKGNILLLGAEAEVFQVTEGPKDIDGYTWWYLVGPYDANRKGWAASNYLSVVQKP